MPRFDSCGEAEVTVVGGGCSPVGVPPDGCAEGFAYDGRGGCTAVLPASPCATGTLAVPGDTACRPVSACGEGKYGPLPAAKTTYVDATYAGGASDGSLARPYVTIQAAIDAAPDQGVIAIARGTYVEDLQIGKRVSLYGHCASEVEVRGATAGAESQTIGVRAAVELHRLAVTGPAAGVLAIDVKSLSLDEVWIHDVPGFGIGVLSRRASAITVRDVLIEHAAKAAVLAAGVELSVERTVIRDTVAPAGEAPNGYGIDAVVEPSSARPATVVVRRSIVERSLGSAILVGGASVSLDGVLVRDTKTRPTGERIGHGLSAGIDPKTKLRPKVSIVGSVFERNRESAVGVDDAETHIERTTIRDTLGADGTGKGGIGLGVRFSGSIEVLTSLIESSKMAAAFVSAPVGLFERVLVRDVFPEDATNGAGFGIVALGGATRPALTLRAVRVERARAAGVFAYGADLTVEGSMVLATAGDARGSFGDGIVLHPSAVAGTDAITPSTGVITGTIVRGSTRAGVSVFASKLSIESSLLACNGFDLDVEQQYLDAGLVPAEAPFTIDDRGGSTCGCETATACLAVTGVLTPLPPPVVR